MGLQLLNMLLLQPVVRLHLLLVHTTAGDISITATDESAPAADESTAAAVECKSTTMDELCSCLVASSSSMPERLDITPGSYGQLSSVDAWLSTLGGTSSRLATALMSDLVACSVQ